MVNLEIKIVGTKEFLDRLSALGTTGMSRAMRRAMEDAVGKVRNTTVRSLRGQILHVKTGRLWQNIQTEVSETGGDVVTGKVGTNVEYAAIHEFGGVTRPHDITQTRTSKKGQQYTVVIHHPGAVVPARPYLRPALEDSIPYIKTAFRNAISEALKGTASGQS